MITIVFNKEELKLGKEITISVQQKTPVSENNAINKQPYTRL